MQDEKTKGPRETSLIYELNIWQSQMGKMDRKHKVKKASSSQCALSI